MPDQLITSQDGSHTIASEQFGVTYHSQFGAVEESITVFISAGYHGVRRRKDHDQLDILEVGFGTGLNAYLTLLEAERYKQLTTYTGIEAYPISPEVGRELNYGSILHDQKHINALQRMHTAEDGHSHRLSDYYIFTKYLETLAACELPSSYDVIYFDAFAPTSQPELWSADVLQRMYDLTKPGGALVTYCAKGQVKRDLRSAGYVVEALPGPGRKREITRAWKPE